MEEQEAFKAKLAEANRMAEESKASEARTLSEFDEREKNIEKELDELDDEREELVKTISKKTFAHYERLLDTKEGRVIVGVDHGSCGGCHMKLQAQDIVNAKSGREMVTCTNCGRLIYHTREMVMADELD
jgi:hypothetical protein